jgi:hypothetical protein
VIFSGVFFIQWGIGVGIEAFGTLGWDVSSSFRVTLAIHLTCCVAAYLWFIMPRRESGSGAAAGSPRNNPPSTP